MNDLNGFDLNDFANFLTRSTGIVAALLAVAALVWGFLFSARTTGHKLRPAWWLDLHNWLGGLALVFTGVHIGFSLLDGNSGIGFLQALVPATTRGDRLGISLGVLAVYLFSLAVFTSWPRRLKHRTLWRVLHIGSVIGLAFALTHTYLSGSDASRLSLRVGLIGAIGLATYALGLRTFELWAKRS